MKIEELEKKAEVADRALRQAKKKEWEDEIIPKLERLLGGCSVIISNYGGGRESWNHYKKILAILPAWYDGIAIVYEEFFCDEDGHSQFHVRHHGVMMYSKDSFLEHSNKISESEYEEAKRKFFIECDKFIKLQKKLTER